MFMCLHDETTHHLDRRHPLLQVASLHKQDLAVVKTCLLHRLGAFHRVIQFAVGYQCCIASPACSFEFNKGYLDGTPSSEQVSRAD